MTEDTNKEQLQAQLDENGQNGGAKGPSFRFEGLGVAIKGISVGVKSQNVEVKGQNVGANVEMTTEQVINAVAARPSWKMALLWVGLMSFMAVGKNKLSYQLSN